VALVNRVEVGLKVTVEEKWTGDRLVDEVFAVKGPAKLDQVEESVSSRLDEG
jgi:hypothetical protein